jgi:predicted dehydrogenase
MRTGILGVGRMGRRYIDVIKKLAFDLVGVFDVSLDALKSVQTEHALADRIVFDDLDRLYEESKPECMIVACTADAHCEMVCGAAERGVKYILVEKPMAVSLDQCDRMIDVCRRHGARLSVNHQMRFMDQYIEPRRLCESEPFGGLASMTMVAGNCGFAMNGTHYLEAFHFMTGEDVVEVQAWFSPETVPNPRGTRFEDRAGCIRAVTSSGKRLYLDISADQGHGLRAIYACRNGMITVDDLSGELLSTVREAQYRDLPTTRYAMPSINARQSIRSAAALDPIAAVVQALVADADRVSGEDGRRAVELLMAAYASAEQGGAAVRRFEALDRHRLYPWA